jgi:hypothetical protein
VHRYWFRTAIFSRFSVSSYCFCIQWGKSRTGNKAQDLCSSYTSIFASPVLINVLTVMKLRARRISLSGCRNMPHVVRRILLQ